MTDLNLSDELIEQLEALSIRTSQGSYVRLEDVRRLQKEKEKAKQEETVEPVPKTLEQARGMAKRHLAEAGIGQQRPGEPGRAISASEPQPPSRA